MNGRAVARDLAAGCGAGLVLTATMLALRLWLAAPAFPERIADTVLLLLPRALFSAGLERLGFAAKPLLFVAIVAAQILAAGVGGLLYGRAARALAGRIDLTNPALGGAGGLLLAVGVDLVLLPVLGLGAPVAARGWPGGAPALAVAALPGLAYGLALAVLLRPSHPARPARDGRAGAGGRGRITRRAAVGLFLPLAGALVTVGSLGRIVGAMWPRQPVAVAAQALPADPVAPTATAPPAPAAPAAAPSALAAAPGGAVGDAAPAAPSPPAPATNTPPPTATVTPPVAAPLPVATPPASGPAIPRGVAALVTPTERFYVISKNFLDPTVAGESWHLTIDGLVERPRMLRLADLRQLPPVSLAATLECISNEAGGELIGTAVWTGVPLRALLAGAAVRPEATDVVFTCADDYVESLPLARATDPTTLLVHAMNGAPLTARHGFPARLLAAGRYGMKNPKWVVRIEVVSRPLTGYWTQRGWQPDAPIRTFTRIDTPSPLLAIPRGPTPVGGVAFTGDQGVSRVEVSADDGATWWEAELEPALSPATWVRWVANWEPPGPGAYTLAARAYDGAGAPQAAETRKPGLGGGTGYGRVRVTVAP